MKKNIPNLKFDIRFHLDPDTKTMKTQDNKSILIELGNEGWKFTCENYQIEIDNGLYFGKKNTYIENQNIFVSGITNFQNNNIKWELEKYNEQNQRALISVSNKKNLKPLLRILKKFKIEIVSSGGIYKKIKNLGFDCIEVSNFTEFPEILEGRVKTLHPKIHAGILYKRK